MTDITWVEKLHISFVVYLLEPVMKLCFTGHLCSLVAQYVRQSANIRQFNTERLNSSFIMFPDNKLQGAPR